MAQATATTRDELTDTQVKVLEAAHRLTARFGFPPTYREVAEECGLSLPTGAVAHLNSLERKGYIRRTPKTTRSIVILRMPPKTAA